MQNKEFIQIVSPEDRLRIRFTKNRGRILQFVVGYEILLKGHWRVVMRYDNCHGSSPHKHTYYLQSKSYKVTLDMSPEDALTESKSSILNNLQSIRANYLSN